MGPENLILNLSPQDREIRKADFSR